MSKNREVQQNNGKEQFFEKESDPSSKNIVSIFLEDCLSINKIKPEQAKTAASSIGTGIIEGSGKRAGNYINHALANPLSSAMELGSSAAIGIGLALANKKLVAGAALLALGDIAFKTTTGIQDTYIATHNYLHGKSDASKLKGTAAKTLGSVTGDALIMAGTGASAGGAIKASKFSLANASKLTSFIKERRSVSKSLHEFSKMESSIFNPTTGKITITPKEIDNKVLLKLTATKELIGRDPIYGMLEPGAKYAPIKTLNKEASLGENLDKLIKIVDLRREAAIHRNRGNVSEAIALTSQSLGIQKRMLPQPHEAGINNEQAISFQKALKDLSLLYDHAGQSRKADNIADLRKIFCRNYGLPSI